MPNRWVAGEEWLKRGLHHHSIVANILWLVHWLALELVSPLTLSHLNTGLHLTGSQQHGFIAARPSLPISRPRPRCFRRTKLSDLATNQSSCLVRASITPALIDRSSYAAAFVATIVGPPPPAQPVLAHHHPSRPLSQRRTASTANNLQPNIASFASIVTCMRPQQGNLSMRCIVLITLHMGCKETIEQVASAKCQVQHPNAARPSSGCASQTGLDLIHASWPLSRTFIPGKLACAAEPCPQPPTAWPLRCAGEATFIMSLATTHPQLPSQKTQVTLPLPWFLRL